MNSQYNEQLYFLISENKKFDEFFEIEAQNLSCNVFNLKIQTQYYWKVCTKDNANYNDVSDIFTFFVGDEMIRNLNIEGVTNARDLGGWKINNTNERTKQGLIYRTAKYNEDESVNNLITEKGIDVMVNQLGIKTEIDLRTVDDNENGGIITSPLGESVTYINLPLKSGGNILSLNKDELANLFVIFGNINSANSLLNILSSISSYGIRYITFLSNYQERLENILL